MLAELILGLCVVGFFLFIRWPSWEVIQTEKKTNKKTNKKAWAERSVRWGRSRSMLHAKVDLCFERFRDWYF
jgi:hypothetical protein